MGATGTAVCIYFLWVSYFEAETSLLSLSYYLVFPHNHLGPSSVAPPLE